MKIYLQSLYKKIETWDHLDFHRFALASPRTPHHIGRKLSKLDKNLQKELSRETGKTPNCSWDFPSDSPWTQQQQQQQQACESVGS